MKARPDAVIAQLRSAGYDVNITHRRLAQTTARYFRNYAQYGDNPTDKDYRTAYELEVGRYGSPSQWGGLTTVTISLRDPETGELVEAYLGEARCNVKDNFNRHLALVIALGRACAVMKRATS